MKQRSWANWSPTSGENWLDRMRSMGGGSGGSGGGRSDGSGSGEENPRPKFRYDEKGQPVEILNTPNMDNIRRNNEQRLAGKALGVDLNAK